MRLLKQLHLQYIKSSVLIKIFTYLLHSDSDSDLPLKVNSSFINIFIAVIREILKKMSILILLSSLLAYTLSYGSEIENPSLKLNMSEIHGYHFHTYFFQDNLHSSQEALEFRYAIQQQIDNGFLANCRLNTLNMVPRGPHPIGSYETCCNKTSISPALTWFMQNHGNLSILLHPLTRYELLDHTTRAMYLGPSLFLDLSRLSPDLGDNIDLCLPIKQ